MADSSNAVAIPMKRKAHSNIFSKIYVRFVARPVGTLAPYARYAVIPSMMFFSMYYGDPPATFWELINPFS
jgi:hypothetical protein